MAALPDEQAAVRAVSPVTGHIPSGWKRIVAVVVIGTLVKFICNVYFHLHCRNKKEFVIQCD